MEWHPWDGETNWLVDCIFVDDDEPVGEDDMLLYAGRLLAYARTTNSRMLAQTANLDGTRDGAFELWFSFDHDINKERFLEKVRADGYAMPGEDYCLMPPSKKALKQMQKLDSLKCIAEVFNAKEMDTIWLGYFSAITEDDLAEMQATAAAIQEAECPGAKIDA